MQPRSKQGPSWANELEQSQPSPSVPDTAVRKPPALKEPPDDASEDKQGEGVSDLDWMRQRMKGGVGISEEKAFEQSDGEEDNEEVRSQSHISHYGSDMSIRPNHSTQKILLRWLSFKQHDYSSATSHSHALNRTSLNCLNHLVKYHRWASTLFLFPSLFLCEMVMINT
jgi:hypothetical protein